MTHIFNLENFDDFSERINMDELYEKKKQHDLDQLTLYNKILNRIHVKIKTTSRQKKDEQFCWFVVPEVIIGIPKYDQGSCIAYVLDKLQDNGFSVKYIHPNTLFICWKYWVPSYVRDQMKKKTGIIVDEFGNKVESKEKREENNNPLSLLTNKPSENVKNQSNENKSYASTKSYQPSGKFIYDEKLMDLTDIHLK